jgi:hypothetical protein
MLDATLACYQDWCRYLNAASVEYRNDGGSLPSGYGDAMLVAHGEFSSVPPWYIRDTGHLNSIEFNLCYNQLSYTALVQGTASNVAWLITHMDANDMQSRKLSAALITRFSSVFHRPMRESSFSGVFWVKRAAIRKGMLFLRTGMVLHTPNGDRACSGEVDTVILARNTNEE